MQKRWIFGLTVAVALGLIGLLAYTSESVHGVSDPGRSTITAPPARVAPAPAEPESGPTVNGTGLMLTY